MLTKFKVPNIVIEQSQALQDHPKAHYLSFRTCEILEDLLEDSFLRDQMSRYPEWNKFDYCSSVTAKPFARVTHFEKADIETWSKFTYAFPSHYSQNKLNAKLAVDCIFNQTYDRHVQDATGVSMWTEQGMQVRCKALVGCDGVRSKVR